MRRARRRRAPERQGRDASGAGRLVAASRPGRPLITFVAAFGVLVAVLATAHAVGLERTAADALTPWIALVAQRLLSLVHADLSVAGNVIAMPGQALRVTEECSGLEIMGILAAAILAYPTAWPRRLTAAVLVVPFVSLVNVVRVASLALVLRHLPTAFEVCHTFVWQGMLILSALGYWLVWSSLDGDRPEARPHA